MKNRFVFFDLGNVLVHFDHQLAIQQLAELSQRSLVSVRQAVFDSGLQVQYESGLISSQQFAQQICCELQVQLDTADVLEAYSAIFSPNNAIAAVLERLQQVAVPMGLLSNTCEAHWNWITRQQWQVPGRWFDFHVLSYEVGAMKPDMPIYETCEQRVRLAPEQIFFTDDRPENTAAAARRGWMTYQYRSTAELAEQLESWLS